MSTPAKAVAIYRQWFAERGYEPDWRVYFIGCDRFVKVGISTYHQLRMREMQILNPHRVWLIGTIRGDMVLERRLHKLLYWVREHGEWFRLTPTVEKVIDALLAEDRQMEARVDDAPEGWLVQ
jgi:hypothetical protein